MKRIIIRSLFLFGILGAVWCWPQPSQAKSWVISSWDSQIRINADSTMTVRETRTFNFDGSFSWVETEVDKQRVVDVTDFKVYNEQNQELTEPDAVITDFTDRVKARLNFSANNEQRTWIFQYTVIGGIGFFEQHDELYWNVLPLEREVTVEKVSATVLLPKEVVNLSDYAQTIYTGPAGSTEELKNFSFDNNRTIRFWGQDILAGEGFTIVASWPKGLVSDPGTLRLEAKIGDKSVSAEVVYNQTEKTGQFTPAAFQLLGANETQMTRLWEVKKFGYTSEPKEIIITRGQTVSHTFNLVETWWYRVGTIIFGIIAVGMWLSPIVAFIWYYRRWKKYGQDPKDKGTIIAQYGPYQDLSPSEMGTLLDERVQLKDITPMIIDLAVRGYLIIEELDSKKIRADYRLTRTDKSESDLRESEQLMLKKIFQSKSEVKLSDLKNKFYSDIPALREALYQAVAQKGYFEESPDKTRKKHLVKPLVQTIVAILAIIVSGIFLPQISVLLIPIIFWGIIGLIFAGFMPRKTPKGVEAKWWTEGFKLYLSTAERFRLGKMTPETFEKYLPYAIVLGVEKKWASRFKDIYTEPPKWFHSALPYAGVFAITNFTNQLSSFTVSTSSHLGSSPGSSSSGFSGGFSGGGGGGGSVSAG